MSKIRGKAGEFNRAGIILLVIVTVAVVVIALVRSSSAANSCTLPCEDFTPICRDDDTCVQCVENQDCALTGGFTKTVCKDKEECVECTKDTDCTKFPGAIKCYTDTFMCGPACRFDGDCAPGSICEGGCTVGCRSDSQCTASPGNPKCDPASHHCVRCVLPTDCGNDPQITCANSQCLPVEQVVCTDNGMCRADQTGRICVGGGCLSKPEANPVADLTIGTIDQLPDPLPVGETLTYTIPVRNNGPDTATGVTLGIEFAPGLSATFVSASVQCRQQSNGITCDLGSLGRGITVQANINVKLAGELLQAFPNTFTVESAVSDNIPHNNERTLFITIARIVNGLVLEDSNQRGFSCKPKSSDSDFPFGTCILRATFENTSSRSIAVPFFEVVELTNGNMLLNGDLTPTGNHGGVGTRLTPDVGNDSVLSPGELFSVTFVIGLNSPDRFTFQVDLLEAVTQD